MPLHYELLMNEADISDMLNYNGNRKNYREQP